MYFIDVEIKRGKKVLNKIFDKYILKNGKSFICGGYARWACSSKRNPISASDIDVYCKDEDTFKFLQEHLIKTELDKIKESNVSVSFGVLEKVILQLIKPISKGHIKTVGTIQDILSNFDFSIARCGIYIEDGKIKAIADADFVEDENKKLLRIKNIHCPIAQIYRVSKYMKKGYWLKPFEAVKILTDWEDREDEYKLKILNWLSKEKLVKEEIDELEAMLHID